MMNRRLVVARLGAVLYVLWGLVHLQAASKVYHMALGLPPGMVQGRLLQEAFYLLFFATAGILIGGRLTWKNDARGYWMNLVLISIGDIPFISFVLLPGYIPLWPGALGPSLWCAALICTTIARVGDVSPARAELPAEGTEVR